MSGYALQSGIELLPTSDLRLLFQAKTVFVHAGAAGRVAGRGAQAFAARRDLSGQPRSRCKGGSVFVSLR